MIPLRDPAGNENVDHVCNELRAAMQGMGTNDAKLIKHMVTRRSNEEMMVLNARYKELHKRDLIADIKSDTSFNFKNTLVALATDKAVLDARLVKTAVKGLGTNEKLLNQILCVRTFNELKAMSAAYEKEFKSTALKDIQDDTSGNLKKLYETLLTVPEVNHPDSNIDIHVNAIYQAGENKWGTNEAVFIDIFSTCSREYLVKLDKAYQAAHQGHTLRQVVKSEFSGNLKEALLVLVTPRGEYWAGELRKAMEGFGTDDSVLIRTLVSQRHNVGLFQEIAAAWIAAGQAKNKAVRDKTRNPADASKTTKPKVPKPDMPIRQWLEKETSGDYKNAILGIWDNFLTAPAVAQQPQVQSGQQQPMLQPQQMR